MTALRLIFEEPAVTEPVHPTLQRMVGIPDTQLVEYVRWRRGRGGAEEGVWVIDLDLLPTLRPRIWAIAGSTERVGVEALQYAAVSLRAQGEAVLQPALCPPSDDDVARLKHRTQLDIADSLYVVNPNGYIGADTAAEVAYAAARGKRVVYLEYL